MNKIKKMVPKATAQTEATGLTQEELSEVQSLNRQYIEAKHRVADFSLMHKRAVDVLAVVDSKLAEVQDKLAQKYGEKPIDLTTGLFKQ